MIVRIQRLAMFLEAHFGDVELHLPEEPVSTGAAEEEETGGSPEHPQR